jgi:3-dehydro-L-gulonate 2-dehydrogenase
MRGLPIGFWKGSGLSLLLDLLATILSKGRSTGDISVTTGKEYGVSQVFIALNAGDADLNERVIASILDYTRSSGAEAGKTINYPGENTLRIREENSRLGIPVDEKIWQNVLSL